MPISNGTACSSPTTARMSAVEPSSDVPIACIWKRTRSWAPSRRWISAMYADALASARPSAMTVRSAVAKGPRLPRLAGGALGAADRGGGGGLEREAALAGVEREVLRAAGALGARLRVGARGPGRDIRAGVGGALAALAGERSSQMHRAIAERQRRCLP